MSECDELGSDAIANEIDVTQRHTPSNEVVLVYERGLDKPRAIGLPVFLLMFVIGESTLRF